MREYSIEDAQEAGNTFLIYGKPGVGKTYALGTLPDPILVIITEPRDPRRVLRANPDAFGKKITFREYESFDEIMEALNSLYEDYKSGKHDYNSICFDSLSFEQSKFKLDLEDSRFDLALEEKKREDTLVDRFRIERGDWGALSSMMKRLTWLLNRLSKFGVNIVATATVVEYPSWNKELVAAPSFQGLEFPSVAAGYFDFIALLTEKSGSSPYPPIAHFVSDGTFLAKSCSPTITERKSGPLNFKKILEVIELDRQRK